VVCCSFFADFGPLNIASLYRYCCKLNKKLKVTASVSLMAVACSHSYVIEIACVTLWCPLHFWYHKQAGVCIPLLQFCACCMSSVCISLRPFGVTNANKWMSTEHLLDTCNCKPTRSYSSMLQEVSVKICQHFAVTGNFWTT